MGSQKKLGENLKSAREKAGLTQVEIAGKVGINSNYYAKVERSERNPSLKTMEKIAKVLKTTVSDLLKS